MKNLQFIFILLIIFILDTSNLLAQVGVNQDNSDPDASAMLDIKSSNKGLLIPRMSSAERGSISSPANGLLVYDTDTKQFWFYNGSQWKAVSLNTDDQTLSLTGSTLSILDGNSIDLANLPPDNDWSVTGDNAWKIAGSVGIGTATPEAKLHVEGTIEVDQKIRANDNGGLEFATDDDIIRLKINDAGQIGIGTTSPTKTLHLDGQFLLTGRIHAGHTRGFEFATLGNNLRMKITDAGNVGIGTFAPAAKLHVEGGAIIKDWITAGAPERGIKIDNVGRTTLHASAPGLNTYGTTIINIPDGNASTRYNGLRITAGRNSNNGSNSRMIQFRRPDGTEIGKIIQNNSNSVAYNTSSDRRLKQNIRPTSFSIEDLMNIEVRDYEFISDPDEIQTGFIAQQLYEVYPDPVTEGGEDAKTDPWNVEYGKLTPLLVKAIQDQQAIIDAQKAEIDALKNVNDGYSSRLDQVEAQLNLISNSQITKK